MDHPITQGSDNVAPCLSDHRSRKRWVRLAVSLSLGIALMVVVYRNFDFGGLVEELRSNSISWGIIALSILIEALGNVFRGVRWKLLVHPFSTPEPRLRNTILSVLGSYAVNLIFPRAGDVWRCAALSRYESLSMAKLIGSLLMDRLMDMLVLGLIVLMAIGGFSDFLICWQWAYWATSFGVSPKEADGVQKSARGYEICGRGCFPFVLCRIGGFLSSIPLAFGDATLWPSISPSLLSLLLKA